MNDNISIVVAAEAEVAAVAVKGDLMLSAANELRVITGCIDAVS